MSRLNSATKRVLKEYFKGELALDDDEIDRRYQMYLELFPFIWADFRLKADCALVHATADLKTKDVNGILPILISKYRVALKELRDQSEIIEVQVGDFDGVTP